MNNSSTVDGIRFIERQQTAAISHQCGDQQVSSQPSAQRRLESASRSSACPTTASPHFAACEHNLQTCNHSDKRVPNALLIRRDKRDAFRARILQNLISKRDVSLVIEWDTNLVGRVLAALATRAEHQRRLARRILNTSKPSGLSAKEFSSHLHDSFEQLPAQAVIEHEGVLVRLVT